MALARVIAISLLALAAPGLAAGQGGAPSPTASIDEWPKGAPRAEYEFTAWCYGALKQHMELYPMVKPELGAISKRLKTEKDDEKSYSDQLAAGKIILDQFARALRAAEMASPRPINVQGGAAVEQGRRVFADFNGADKSNQAYAWMTWVLPNRCEKVSEALENKSILLGQALQANASPATPPPVALKPPVKDAETPNSKAVGLR